MIPVQDWVFQANMDRVVDGDTVHLTVDLGMHSMRTESFRLARVNAPEMSTPQGPVAKAFVTQWFFESTLDQEYDLIITTHKTDNWGRYIVEIWRKIDGANLSDDLLSSGNAVPWP